jgi:dipeptide/tripeptide permease
MVFAGSIALAAGFAFVAASGRGLGWLIVGMVLLDLGNRAGLVANQAAACGAQSQATAEGHARPPGEHA